MWRRRFRGRKVDGEERRLPQEMLQLQEVRESHGLAQRHGRAGRRHLLQSKKSIYII